MDIEFLFYKTKSSGDWLYNNINVLNITELYTKNDEIFILHVYLPQFTKDFKSRYSGPVCPFYRLKKKIKHRGRNVYKFA